MSAIQGSGLEGCPQFRGLDFRGGSANQESGLEGCLQFMVWIRGVSPIQGSGLEGLPCSLHYIAVLRPLVCGLCN